MFKISINTNVKNFDQKMENINLKILIPWILDLT